MRAAIKESDLVWMGLLATSLAFLVFTDAPRFVANVAAPTVASLMGPAPQDGAWMGLK